LKAGVATVELDAPIGVPMGGYSRTRPDGDPGSPWAQRFPASRGMFTRPTVRALALDNGVSKVVIIRADVPLVTPSLQARATERFNTPEAALVVVGTHSHAGPARFFQPAYVSGGDHLDVPSVAMDVYDPEIEDRMAQSIAQAATAALAALVPVAMGTSEVDGTPLNHDRRCENDSLYGPNYVDSKLRVIRFDAVMPDGSIGMPVAGLVNFAMHGTLLDESNTLFSTDAPGALERAATAQLGAPVLYLQGDAGDASPDYGGYGATQSVDLIAAVGAPIAKKAFDAAKPTSADAHATLAYTLRAASILSADIGYQPHEYPVWGAVECGLGGPDDCSYVYTEKNMICLPLTFSGITQVALSALQLGDHVIVFLPGEPVTAIGDHIRNGSTTTWVVGYALGHNGYLLEHDDFLHGGYEPTVSPWGWRFGDYMEQQAKDLLGTLGKPQPTFQPPLLPDVGQKRPIAQPAVSPGVMTQPMDVERLQTAVFAFHGADPGLGAPHVSLEVMQAGAFVSAGFVADGPDIVLRYDATPTFKADPAATTRDHVYTAQWETLPDTPAGTYRFVTEGITSAPFNVTPSQAAGALSSAVIDSGALKVQLRFPPNPVLYGTGSEVIGNYRMRDVESLPEQGALVRGGHATAHVTDPNGMTSDVMLTWSGSALSAQLTAATPGHWSVAIDAQGAVDAQGNTNGAAVHADVNL
jgi:neutral ceramidase